MSNIGRKLLKRMKAALEKLDREDLPRPRRQECCQLCRKRLPCKNRPYCTLSKSVRTEDGRVLCEGCNWRVSHEKRHQYPYFSDWYYEMENYSIRAERLASDRAELEAAFEAGRATQA